MKHPRRNRRTAVLLLRAIGPCALDGVGVHLDAAVVEEAQRALPVIEAVARAWAIVEPPASRASVVSSQVFSARRAAGFLPVAQPGALGALAADLGSIP